MVKGITKASKASGLGLLLECKNEDLSDVQILHRKKQLEDLYILQGALQGSAQIASSQLMGLMQRNANIPNGKNGGIPNKRKMPASKGTGTPDVSPVVPVTQPSPQQQPKSLTQALRATRKTTGSLPPSKINLNEAENEPEIEVLQEMRPSAPIAKTNQSLPPPQIGGLPKPILPKPNVAPNRGPLKPAAIKANNLLLLNINVRPRNLAPVSVNSMKRKELDSKVKVVLMKTPSEFVEWLLRQGLIRSQQLCNTHKTLNRQPAKLKLGMFSDPKVLTSSGGYVWIGECCGRKYISVYSGSIFGSTPIDKVPPTSVLKLIYHWACQTSISNVETWVKVDKQFISKIYHYLKCICSVILHDKVYDFGIEGTPVELGIVSLGTTTADGSRKAVKVEILGLYNRCNKSYRLFASTPEPASNSRERFLRILKPVKGVVHRNARIVCDQSVDPTCLHSMGYMEVEVCYSSENENDPKTNSVIMFYLRKHVPKMFQAALSQLTEHQVQLTLDELCWREKYAATSAECYDNIMDNVSYITFRELENPGVLPLLEFVAEYPHNNFRYKTQLNSKGIPSVPASVILAPTSAPLNVVPSQYSENKCLVMTNKVMMKNGVEVKEKEIAPISIKNLTSIPTSTFKQQPLTSTDHAVNNSVVSPVQIPALQRSSDYKDLEPYFYGRIEGNPALGKEHNTYIFKCHMCSETIDDNIMFYAHLKFHFENQQVDKEKLDLMCPYCTKAFPSINSLNKHKIDVHLMSDLTQVWCRICAEKFQNESLLKTHMMRKHVEAELPYRCEVCHFATSFYYEIINHFARSHKGTPYVQCHFCLCVKTLTPNGAASFSTRLFQHLQKHNQKINCRSCVLIFYSKYLLSEHKKEHISCANVNGVVRYESPNGYRILQFKPNIRSMPIGPTAQATTLVTKNQAALSVTQQEFPDLKMMLPDEQDPPYKCVECDSLLDTKYHFNQYRKCSKCPYFTCCQNMILRHSQVFHPNQKKPLPFHIGNPILMERPLYCLCGFSSNSGHHTAKHLVMCKKQTAYPYIGVVDDTCNGAEAPVDMEPCTDELEIDTILPDVPPPDDPMEIDDEVLPMLPLSVEIEED